MKKLNPVKITSDLIKCQSVTPKDDGAIELVKQLLLDGGFECQIITRNGIQNLFARWGSAKNGPTLCFNGHTDVVSAGKIKSWADDPFSAVERDGFLFGRGAADMKSALGAFISAAVNYVNEDNPTGSIVIAITGDEEGEATDGTLAILDWMSVNNEKIDHCIVGEPTSVEFLGDTIKIGRRGSLTAKLTVRGLQGHVAYPEKAINPIPALTELLSKLEKTILDNGNKFFDPSSFVITTIDTGNTTNNIIPETVKATVNIRFNDLHTKKSLTAWLTKNIHEVTTKTGVNIKLDTSLSAMPFVNEPGKFSDLVRNSIKSKTKISPSFSTSGGTSDARFITKYCPVLEFGLVGKTMHKTDENVEIKQITGLAEIYRDILKSYFGNHTVGV